MTHDEFIEQMSGRIKEISASVDRVLEERSALLDAAKDALAVLDISLDTTIDSMLKRKDAIEKLRAVIALAEG